MGLLNNVIPFSLIVWGQTQIGSGLASILNATTPLFTVVAAHFLTRDEQLTKARLTGILIGFSGVIIMIGHEALYGLGENMFAQLAILGAALSYSFAGIFGRRFQKMGIKPLVTATGQVSASSVLLIPLALFVDQPWNLPLPGWEVVGAVLGLALFSTSLAYILYFRILSTAGATNVLLVTLLIPLSAIVLGSTFLGEQLELKHFLGMGLISFGLLAIDGRVFRFMQHHFCKRPAAHPVIKK
jgi:drug/metabolite transporter (DMT)-like permease